MGEKSLNNPEGKVEYNENNQINDNGKRDKKRTWIVPKNNLKNNTILGMLKRENEDYLITKQGLGASWEMLEPEILKELKNRGFRIFEEDISRLSNLDKEIQVLDAKIENSSEEYKTIQDENKKAFRRNEIEELSKQEERRVNLRKLLIDEILDKMDLENSETQLYGVDLQGNYQGVINIDYQDYLRNDDKNSSKPSIEQVAEILGVKLTINEKFVLADDKGYIPEMERLGNDLGLNEEDLQEIIKNIRIRDREIQGTTKEEEAQAVDAIEKLGDLTGRRDIIMTLPHSKTSTVTDRLYGLYDNLLILCKDGKTKFFGSTEIINMLMEKFGKRDEFGRHICWKGGNLIQGSGYWVGYVDQEAIKNEIEKLINNRQGKGIKINEKNPQEGQ